MHVREDGRADGPVLVLLHGFCGSLNWYDRVVPTLGERFRLIRLDLLGHGRTGGAAADAPVQARAVTAVLEGLGVADATVVGHSFGADVAVELAQRSDRINRLVIVCQAPDYSDATLPRASPLVTVPVLGRGLVRTGQALAGGVDALVRRTGHPVLPPLATQGLHDFRLLDPAMFRVVLTERRERMARHPLDAQVREAGKPALVILGGQDHFYGARSANRYLTAGARVEVLPDSGHSPLIQFPTVTAELIQTFVPTSGERVVAP